MDGSNPKVSFIPKGPLTRDESFLERKRPRSAIGFLATISFIFSIGSYVGLYYYDLSLAKVIVAKTESIREVQSSFSKSIDVAEAKLFRSRAELAKELLLSHVTVSPIFTFLSYNTLESVMYDKFSFKKGVNGWELALDGEAPTYASLAYQSDKLREKTKELAGFSVDNIALTKFGNVSFALKMVFAPKYLSYTTGYEAQGSQEASVSEVAPEVTNTPEVVETKTPVPFSMSQSAYSTSGDTGATTTSFVAETPTSTESVVSLGWDRTPVSATATTPVAETKSWWAWFKFW